jgi:hypothetical protein
LLQLYAALAQKQAALSNFGTTPQNCIERMTAYIIYTLPISFVQAMLQHAIIDYF